MKNLHKLFGGFLLVGLSLALTLTTFAQAGSTGSLDGIVLDANNAVVSGVNVTVKNAGTNQTRTAITNNDGAWTIPALSVGIYEVSYEKDGFNKFVNNGVTVEASVPRSLVATLQVKGVGDNIVTVTADAPLLTPETATTARQITGEEVTKLPTSTRSFTQLLSTEAGVSTDLSPVAVNGNGNQSPSVNGTRTTSTSLSFNGVDATNITSNEGSLNDNIAPAPETLQEVKLQTSLYDASTGRSGGGNFQLVTKGGNNRFSGSAYYYLQNKKLNSNEFFFKKAEIEKPKADRYETGFTIGGPVIKDKFFFFGGYQRTKAETGFVPTARSRTVLPQALTVLGDNRSKSAIAAAFNQFNGCTIGTNCLTENDISDVALRIFNLRNPATGGFVLPSIAAGGFRLLGTVDQSGSGAFQFGSVSGGGVTSRTLQRNNPLIEVINVLPSKFEQDQFTTRLDGQLSQNNALSGTFFYSDFPGLDSFPDPSSLASAFTLKRNDRSRVLSVSDTHIFSPTFINEVRFGYFYLNNTRALDDPYLEITNASIGVANPALAFDDIAATRRLGHYIGRNNLANFSFGGPNDSFNRRKQTTVSIADNVTWVYKNHTFKFGGEIKRSQFDTNLPEEQATEFEKFDSFTQLLTGNATEADTQFGITQKSFRLRDYSFYITDDWKITNRLTLNFGVRYELFKLPTEKDGRIGNFDLADFQQCFEKTGGTATRCDDPTRGFIVPSNVVTTGNGVIDGAIGATRKVENQHTLNGEDKNNFAPRIGLAYKINDKLAVRGGYGLFYDRPSASFINTVFSNYPFLREVEITSPGGNVPIATAFSNTPTSGISLNQWLPFRIVRVGGSYQIRDNTPIFVDARGAANPVIPGSPAGTTCNSASGLNCIRGNVAETFEFRAVDRDLKTPMIHQWNVGVQYEIAKNWLIEARYIGTAGRKLLVSRALNQGYDLNDPNAPDHIFERFNQAWLQANPGQTLNAGTTARERGLGKAFGFSNPFRTGLGTPTCTVGSTAPTFVSGSTIDYNLAAAFACNSTTGVLTIPSLIGFEARVPILGFNVPEALLLQSNGDSDYNSLQFALTKRFSKGLQFNLAYTLSKSEDIMSSDPGSTAGGGKPDVPNTGFIAQGDSRDLEANRALSDFDRKHRFSLNFVYEIQGGNNAFTKGWQVSGFFQYQTGTPYSIFAGEPEIGTANQYTDIVRGSGGLYRPGFGRPNVAPGFTPASVNTSGTDIRLFSRTDFQTALGGFGNLPRNAFRGPSQRRLDIGFAKNTKISERLSFEIGFDMFNLLNTVNFRNPNNDLQDTADFGLITETVGGPRVGQFRVKFRF